MIADEHPYNMTPEQAYRAVRKRADGVTAYEWQGMTWRIDIPRHTYRSQDNGDRRGFAHVST